jgi:hypothetical protein
MSFLLARIAFTMLAALQLEIREILALHFKWSSGGEKLS